MNMKLNLFKRIVLIVSLVLNFPTIKALSQNTQPSDSIKSPEIIAVPDSSVSAYEIRKTNYTRRWNNLIPKYSKIQFVGGMGLLSLGTGWEYGSHRQWETDLFFGIIPKHSSEHARLTMTLKQNFTPWKLPLKNRFSFEPLSTGLYLNTVFGNEFWTKNPDRYPSGYYWFSTRMRIHIFIGQRICFNIPDKRRHFFSSITAFYELSTCDLYVIQAVKNSYLTAKDYLRLSFGLKFSFF